MKDTPLVTSKLRYGLDEDAPFIATGITISLSSFVSNFTITEYLSVT